MAANGILDGVNGTSTPISNSQRCDGLRILIVGAGIAGLTAAIGLRKQGHHVEVRRNNQRRGASQHRPTGF